MKKWISLFLAALLVVGMAACSAPAAAPDAQAGQAQADQPEASGEEMVVVEAYIVQPDWSDAWDVMEARFEEQYPWIDVESVGMGASASDFISTRASVNDLPDVTQIDNNYMWQTLCDEGNIMDLTGRDVCQYIPQSYLDAYTYNGQLIGITQGAAFSTMYYNMQQLQQAVGKGGQQPLFPTPAHTVKQQGQHTDADTAALRQLEQLDKAEGSARRHHDRTLAQGAKLHVIHNSVPPKKT